MFSGPQLGSVNGVNECACQKEMQTVSYKRPSVVQVDNLNLKAKDFGNNSTAEI